MKTLLVGLAAVVALASLPLDASEAHGHARSRAHVSVGVGFGYPAYRPYRYYPGYSYGYSVGGYYPGYSYGYSVGGYYPGSYLGISVWPRYRSRERTRTRGEIRNDVLYVYPAAGQSEAQLAEDRGQCHVWAADTAAYDPTQGAGTRDEAESYGRAFTACMEGRSYVVK